MGWAISMRLLVVSLWYLMESLTRASYSSRYHAVVDTRPSLWLLAPSRYIERANPLRVSLFYLAYWLFRSWFTCFRENPTYFSIYTWRLIPGIVCGAIHGSWSEMLGNGQTDTCDNYSNRRCACAPKVYSSLFEIATFPFPASTCGCPDTLEEPLQPSCPRYICLAFWRVSLM
jgi:hypothetical protein